eukprot:TRINITY_DN2101_c2_g1_i1.p1 TRINITY_DN2101_c2_g1~~TRINITY_DN2101_c2_g1_i1.p1  ORF type:complete len:289 (-),score=-34.42 TRINITY_DN2101_c2_g1_i1:538-1404(-)
MFNNKRINYTIPILIQQDVQIPCLYVHRLYILPHNNQYFAHKERFMYPCMSKNIKQKLSTNRNIFVQRILQIIQNVKFIHQKRTYPFKHTSFQNYQNVRTKIYPKDIVICTQQDCTCKKRHYYAATKNQKIKKYIINSIILTIIYESIYLTYTNSFNISVYNNNILEKQLQQFSIYIFIQLIIMMLMISGLVLVISTLARFPPIKSRKSPTIHPKTTKSNNQLIKLILLYFYFSNLQYQTKIIIFCNVCMHECRVTRQSIQQQYQQKQQQIQQQSLKYNYLIVLFWFN